MAKAALKQILFDGKSGRELVIKGTALWNGSGFVDIKTSLNHAPDQLSALLEWVGTELANDRHLGGTHQAESVRWNWYAVA
jgi:hypothetical protein